MQIINNSINFTTTNSQENSIHVKVLAQQGFDFKFWFYINEENQKSCFQNPASKILSEKACLKSPASEFLPQNSSFKNPASKILPEKSCFRILASESLPQNSSFKILPNFAQNHWVFYSNSPKAKRSGAEKPSLLFSLFILCGSSADHWIAAGLPK